MSKFKQDYKSKGFDFGKFGATENRVIRAKRYEEARRAQRAENFNKNRNINSLKKAESKVFQSTSKERDPSIRLSRLKTDRDNSKQTQVAKKPAFIVGKVHHKIYSPTNTEKRAISETRVKRDVFPKRVSKDLIKEAKTINKKQEDQKKHEKPAVINNLRFKTSTRVSHVPSLNRLVLQNNYAKAPTISRKLSLSNERVTAEPNTRQHISLYGIKDSSVKIASLKLSFDDKGVSNNNAYNDDSNSNNRKILVNKNKEPNHSVEHNDSETSLLNNTYNKSTSTFPDSVCEPVFLSPYIVSSRGKSNARKEQQLRRGFSLSRSFSDDIPTKDNVMKNLNVSVEEEERTAQYFHFLLNRETERLNELCKKWMKIKAQPKTTLNGQYEINQTIEQTNLLIKKKFERFRQLVADCETGKGKMLVTCKDLQGFWDTMYIGVKNCDLQFEKLEMLHSQGWKEKELLADKPVAKKKTIVRNKVVPTKSSSIRAFLAKKKKNMAEEIRNNVHTNKFKSNLDQIANNKFEKNQNTTIRLERKSMSVDPKENKFTLKQDKRLSSLQKLQLSDLSKKTESLVTVMNINQMCKTPKLELDNTISYINSDQTPAKSILKQPKSTVKEESHLKSRNKVNFDDHIVASEVPIDEESKIKMDLAASLSRIDSFDFVYPDEVTINAERKLNFDDSLEESKNDKHSENKNSPTKDISKISSTMTETTPLQESNKNLNIHPRRRSIRRQNAVDESDEILNKTSQLNKSTSATFKETTDDTELNVLKEKLQKYVCISNEEIDDDNENIKVLRNRIVTSTNTPRTRSSRKVSINQQQPEHKENETPLERRKRNSSFKVNIDSDKTMDVDNNDDTHSEQNIKTRRSTRRVNFSDKETCDGDGTSKPTLPLTPYVRRSRTRTSGKKRRSTVSEDCISWETPKKRPERIKRSESKSS